MPHPTERRKWLEELQQAHAKLDQTLADLDDAAAARLRCFEDPPWTARDVVAVRLWWTQRVTRWVRDGQRGRTPTTPAPGYGWKQTPALNAETVARSRGRSLASLRTALRQAVQRTLSTAEGLSHQELFEPGAFEWAGSWPVSRWIAVNTTRQYRTARTAIRRAIAQRG